MKQVLILALGCSVYRKNPQVRLEIDNTFVDEFDLPHTVSPEKLKEEHNLIVNNLPPGVQCLLNPKPLAVTQTYRLGDKIVSEPWLIDNSFIKIINLSEISKKNCIEIKYSIVNNDNNFTNGFLTKFTAVYPILFTILPYSIFKNPSIFYKRYRFARHNINNINIIKKYYSRKQEIIENYFYSFTREKSLFGNNSGCMFYATGKTEIFSFKIYKKYGFWSTTPSQKGFSKVTQAIELVKIISDKYYKNEDTRSNNT